MAGNGDATETFSHVGQRLQRVIVDFGIGPLSARCILSSPHRLAAA